MTQQNDIREELAAYAHKAWAGWMKYLFSKCDATMPNILSALNSKSLIIPAEFVERWVRQMNTPYSELPEDEKESDRKEAEKMMAIMDGKTLI